MKGPKFSVGDEVWVVVEHKCEYCYSELREPLFQVHHKTIEKVTLVKNSADQMFFIYYEVNTRTVGEGDVFKTKRGAQWASDKRNKLKKEATNGR